MQLGPIQDDFTAVTAFGREKINAQKIKLEDLYSQVK